MQKGIGNGRLLAYLADLLGRSLRQCESVGGEGREVEREQVVLEWMVTRQRGWSCGQRYPQRGKTTSSSPSSFFSVLDIPQNYSILSRDPPYSIHITTTLANTGDQRSSLLVQPAHSTAIVSSAFWGLTLALVNWQGRERGPDDVRCPSMGEFYPRRPM
ncbi:uncharacterized protein BP01DRAFT_36224 [Aspergillus saccharolyticus JOP 1030-1]|uniref:Uncharacterized protein n=1 Tax=Aspergillus saccharolyticus JOP 1030-1 TaxID=1450539 RepID=A0A318ZDS6_9EURO|nr:hypothetical protein BP01DRAFT_36224 [Aspergillus saccharolyticus JOP 1030-1]PYH45671.1 hypothetical protein BP01DRAFT_36224 [Aspergillus saccharolyticus JOP 1030-1]